MTERTYTLRFIGAPAAIRAAQLAVRTYFVDGGGEDLLLDGVLAPSGLDGEMIAQDAAELVFHVHSASPRIAAAERREP